MNWSDDAIFLAARPFGEGAALSHVFARQHGLFAGIVHGRRRQGASLQPGCVIKANWRARLHDHLGTLTIEPVKGVSPAVLSDGSALAALQAITALAIEALPERDPHPGLFDGLAVLLETLGEPSIWPAALVRWELGLLGELGFGLELDRCALTGSYDDLAFVSPRTGRAANRAAAAPYADRLLPLPAFLVEGQGVQVPSWAEIRDGLGLTGHFLAQRVFAAAHKPLPEARLRLQERIDRLAASSANEIGDA